MDQSAPAYNAHGWSRGSAWGPLPRTITQEWAVSLSKPHPPACMPVGESSGSGGTGQALGVSELGLAGAGAASGVEVQKGAGGH